MANQVVMNRYFEMLKTVLVDNDIFDKPSHIFNADESAFSMESRTGKVVVPKGSKQAYSSSKGPRDHITTHVCVSASGQVLPPMIIFEKNWPSAPYARQGPLNTLYATSLNGYMDQELFLLWFRRVFLPNTRLTRPALLIMDGHESHITWELVKESRQNDVLLLLLPPHTTNILQPLDVAIFGPMKINFSKLTDATKLLAVTANYSDINKTNFSAVFKEAFEKTMSIATVRNGFRKCGICPYNPDAIDKSRLMPTSKPLEKNIAPPLEVPPTSTPPTSTPAASTPAASTAAASVDFSVDTPVAANNTTSVAMSPAEPFVTAGIIPQHLADVLLLPTPRPTKIKNTRVITTSRVITNDEYEQLLLQKKEKVERIEKEKRERKEERDRKKALKESRREENKAKANPRKKTKNNYAEFESESSEEESNKERARRKSVRNKATKLSRILKKTWSTDESESEDDVDLEECGRDLQGKASKLIKSLRRPSSISSDNEHDSGENDDMCRICHMEDPPNQAGKKTKWIGCSQQHCLKWYHVVCEGATHHDVNADAYICKACQNMHSIV